jgi:DNA-binding MarR family transcriptional regulator
MVSFTPKQGQMLAFIYQYRKLHRQGPAETDMARYFQLTPPAAHAMVVKLEEKGLLSREPEVPRSVKVTLPEKDIPKLAYVEGPGWR